MGNKCLGSVGGMDQCSDNSSGHQWGLDGQRQGLGNQQGAWEMLRNQWN